jgi:hypothetical protein
LSSIETLNPGIGANPYKALFILGNGGGIGVSQAHIYIYMSESSRVL